MGTGNTLSNPPPLDLSYKPFENKNCKAGSLESEDMVNTGREEFDFSFESVVPSYDTPVYHDKGTLPKKGGGPVLLLQNYPHPLSLRHRGPYHFPTPLNT